jgi:2-polyprenyl-3-methyl-5-hydroxy-6-metoxy-1,4-benzoquinol methylase
VGHDVMQQLYDRYDAKQFATGTPDIGSFDHPRFVQICRLVGEYEKILDVGSGYGEFSQKLAKRGKKVVAWDIIAIHLVVPPSTRNPFSGDRP